MKLFLFQVGRVRVPDQAEETLLPVPAYLVETDTGEHILIDTGLDRRLIGKAHTQPPFRHLLNAEEDLLAHLAQLNLTAQDISLVICSHFDPDHAGNLTLFRQAEIVVQRRLYAAAIKGEVPRFELTRNQWDAPGLRFLLVDGDTTLLPQITLLASDGHTPGHQSVLLALPKTGSVLLAIDALPSQDHRDPATRAIEPFDLNEQQVRASTSKLRDIEKQEDVALTIYGHDPHQWETLKRFPDFYE
jgi:N-acyl homoserine lactone hydrolase